MNRRFVIGFFILVFLLISNFLIAGSVVVSWDPNSEGDLAGYKIYYGVDPGIYGMSIDVGNITQFSVPGLDNRVYYFAVTAYDNAGNESGFSAEVSILVSGDIDPPPLGFTVAIHQNELYFPENGYWEIYGHREGSDSGLYLVLSNDTLRFRVLLEAMVPVRSDDDMTCHQRERFFEIGGIQFSAEQNNWRSYDFLYPTTTDTVFINFNDDCYVPWTDTEGSDANLRIRNIQILAVDSINHNVITIIPKGGLIWYAKQ